MSFSENNADEILEAIRQAVEQYRNATANFATVAAFAREAPDAAVLACGEAEEELKRLGEAIFEMYIACSDARSEWVVRRLNIKVAMRERLARKHG